MRSVEAGDTTECGAEITIEPAIEVGNIFKLGTRYSEALGATFLDENGKRAPDRHGLLRHRPRANRRGGRRAGRGRAGHRVAAGSSRRGRSSWSAWAAARTRRPRPPTRSTPSSPRPGSTRFTTTARPEPGEKLTDAELDRLPPSHRRRQAHAGRGTGRSAGPRHGRGSPDRAGRCRGEGGGAGRCRKLGAWPSERTTVRERLSRRRLDRPRPLRP